MDALTPQLETTAGALVAPGRGVLDLDASPGGDVGGAWEALSRNLPGAGRALAEHVSGVVLRAHVLGAGDPERGPGAPALVELDILPGVSARTGPRAPSAAPGSPATAGLDGLLARALDHGARFACCHLRLGTDDRPPDLGDLRTGTRHLAHRARLCQAAGLVPLLALDLRCGNAAGDGAGHAALLETVLRSVFTQLHAQGVAPEGLLLATGAVVASAARRDPTGLEAAVEGTLRCLRRAVPAAVPGVLLLAGDDPERATATLNALNAHGTYVPWALSFLFAPGPADLARSQDDALLSRVGRLGAATLGQWGDDTEDAGT